jgi:hypothetical protein
MRNNNIGLYVGFSLFAIQTITGELYRDYKMKQQHNKQIETLLSTAKNINAKAT